LHFPTHQGLQFKWVWGPQYSTKPLPRSHCRRASDTGGIAAPRREAAAKPCAVPDLRQRLPLIIQHREAQGSCQSSTKGSRAGLGRWDAAKLVPREMGGAFIFSCRKPPW
ncbi:hypothetical protein N306_06397, partial [Opisthocomus hoazin]